MRNDRLSMLTAMLARGLCRWGGPTVVLSATLGAAPALAVDWNGFYAGVYAGYGFGSADVTIPGGGGTSTSVCRTNSFGDLPLVVPPTGTLFQSALTNNQVYPGSVAALLGLTQIDGSDLYEPTTQMAFDYRGLTPYVADDECIFHTAYALYGGEYYGGAQGTPSFPIPELPPDFRPSDSAGTIVTTTTPGGPDTETSARFSGLVGGLQAGWNHVINDNLVVGAEGGVFLSGLSDDDIGIGAFGTLSARFGYVLPNAPVMIFSSLGPAFGQVRQGDDTTMGFGWSAGMGVEYQLDSGIGLRAESRHVELHDDGSRASANIVLVGVTMKL